MKEQRFPTQAIWAYTTECSVKVTVVQYLGKDKFKILDHFDHYRNVRRSALTFLTAQTRRRRLAVTDNGFGSSPAVPPVQRPAQPVSAQLALW